MFTEKTRKLAEQLQQTSLKRLIKLLNVLSIFCDNVSCEKFWQAIELLMEAGFEFSEYCGRIEEGNGYLYCDPEIEKHNKEKLTRRLV